MLQLAPSRAGSPLVAQQKGTRPLPWEHQATGLWSSGMYRRNNTRNNVNLHAINNHRNPPKATTPVLLPPTDPLRSRPASPMKQGMEDWIVSACFIEPHGIMSITARYCSLSPTPITPLAPSLPLAARKYCTSGRHGRTRTLVPTPGPSRADGAKEDARRTARCEESGQLW